ncbi:uncharacterized protein LOC110453518 isoform X2 [Mizuhopecten yessoensis]|uniref:uncharacterized protein LOC110453518 isoform X2 n=1 Tax=Mizuhopecten yessoensis TaxID=6573 RepID=UPI000B458900|nr:uncharacterized protein LOC110453518 isoform X2 [Mizuhopecten yessoensis]
MPPCNCWGAMRCVYFEDKNNFIRWIFTEILACSIITIFTVARLSQGAELRKADILFFAFAIGACMVAILITIACRLTVRRCTIKRNHGSLQGSDCAICLEEQNVMVKPVVEITCRHTYHQSCISKYFEIDKTANCPQCRRPLGQFSTTERFVAFIQSLLKKKTKERTLNAEATTCQSSEKKNSLETPYFPECSGYTRPPPEAVV